VIKKYQTGKVTFAGFFVAIKFANLPSKQYNTNVRQIQKGINEKWQQKLKKLQSHPQWRSYWQCMMLISKHLST